MPNPTVPIDDDLLSPMILLGVNSNVGNGNGTKDASEGVASMPLLLRLLPTFKSLIPSSSSDAPKSSGLVKSLGMTLGYAMEVREKSALG